MNATLQANRGSRLRMVVVFTGVLMIAACASTPPVPTANLQAAQQAIAAAERSEAARYAPGELSEAHTKLALADTAVTEKKMGVAEHFADQSRAEAELASAKSSAAKANTVKSYLAGQGIGSIRLSASGKGQSDPVAGNDSAAGRQQNRRVEVIISNPSTGMR
jgi:hypothetical protein